MSFIYPWQQTQWHNLMQRRANARMPHALLLTGPAGLGKHHFSEQLAQSLLCQNPGEDGQGCGHCQHCQLYLAGTHPDYVLITFEEGSSVIKIDQIRALREEMEKKSQMGGYKIVLIDPAEQMNQSAANSLLKTLEEPGANTLLVLVTSMPGRLSATIRSRCQKLAFSPPATATAISWLQQQGIQQPELPLAMAQGSPLQALYYNDEKLLQQRQALFQGLQQVITGKEDPIQLARAWHADNLSACLSWMNSWVMDMIRMKSAAQPGVISNPDCQAMLHTLAGQLDFVVLFNHLDRLKKALRLAETQVNSQLLLEELLISWAPE